MFELKRWRPFSRGPTLAIDGPVVTVVLLTLVIYLLHCSFLQSDTEENSWRYIDGQLSELCVNALDDIKGQRHKEPKW